MLPFLTIGAQVFVIGALFFLIRECKRVANGVFITQKPPTGINSDGENMPADISGDMLRIANEFMDGMKADDQRAEDDQGYNAGIAPGLHR